MSRGTGGTGGRRRGTDRARPNPLHAARLTSIDYKDTDLLRRFVSDRGKIRSRRLTGLTVRQQKEMARAVKNAREMALLPYATPTAAARRHG
ncbi:30S ribosomal protein S18 [Streptomyces bohaiensis]|uniref:Small ribosomal subunit protein bS18 n=1 Tax=Streptomyces bohaiensis TaxID=1431344 RepID=A0ABX1CEV0_9ACTN|nr:30S ribosomal protein S18 [Streptomyces bohaiensis]NJQ16438.1 30S ribosomal protein S18 [Streptomyces bohaiensis]